jgi:hypothetical protein
LSYTLDGDDSNVDSGILGHDRDGNEKHFPFISMSVALLDAVDGDSFNVIAILKKLMQLKQYAKAIEGSAYVRDRRVE